MQQNPTKIHTNRFNAALAFAPTIEIALRKLVVIITKLPAQVQTNQKNGTVRSARTSLRYNGNFNIDGQRANYGWSTGSQHGKQQR